MITTLISKIILGLVEQITDDGLVMIHQKNKFMVGDEISIMLFDGKNKHVKVVGIFDEKMIPMESAPHPKQLLYLQFDNIEEIKPGMVMRSRHCEA